ncbi:MAG: rRNA maturation RNase YbeY [Kistimonas sp.]|nr:rRNA maturation RNase YbeY [Kistimonas sp.]
MSVMLDLQVASCSRQLPTSESLSQWVSSAVGTRRTQAQVSVRLVDAEEGQQLNWQWRGIQKATNVLSFPADLPQEVAAEVPLLGDIVVCVPVVEQEARTQDKSLAAHWAHMVVHGTLHLLGYDHQTGQEALVMERLEADILRELGFDDPYEDPIEGNV